MPAVIEGTTGPCHYRRKPARRGPKRFRYFGQKAHYHFDPATSRTNRHKRTFGGNFDGITGQHSFA